MSDLPYDNAELDICIEWTEPDGLICCEAGYTEAEARKAVKADDNTRWMYSVYWHLKEGGVEHVADFTPSPEGKRRAEILCDAMESYAKAQLAA